MSDIVRYPRLSAGPAGRSEARLVQEILAPTNLLRHGGEPFGVDVGPFWLNNAYGTATSFCSITLEFTADGPLTLGNGTTELIGLFGRIVFGVGTRTLLGILGVNLGSTLPQIPIISASVGYSQVVSLAALYSELTIGGVNGAIATGGPIVTVVGRPIITKAG